MKKMFLVLAAFLFTFTLAACGGSEDTLRLGTIGPLTGDYSLYGTSVRDGAQLAVNEINAAGGALDMQVELFAYDSKGDSVEGVNAYNRLRDVDEVHAVIGGTFSGVTLAIKEIAIEDGMPLFSPTATNAEVTLDAYNVFRACYKDDFQGQMAAKFAGDDLGLTKAAVIYNREDAYSEGLATAFIKAFDAYGEIVAEESYGASDKDYNAILDNVKATDAEIVFLPGYVAEVGAILTQASSKGIDVPFIGGDGWDSIEVDYADVAEGNYFGNHYAKTDSSAVVQDFIAAYEAEYGTSPNALAALAYDAVYAAVQAFEESGSTDADDFIAALSAIDFSGVTGHISFDANGDPIKEISIIQVEDGEHKFIKRLSAD